MMIPAANRKLVDNPDNAETEESIIQLQHLPDLLRKIVTALQAIALIKSTKILSFKYLAWFVVQI